LGGDLGVVGGAVGDHAGPRFLGEGVDGGVLLALLVAAAVGHEGHRGALQGAGADGAGSWRPGSQVDAGGFGGRGAGGGEKQGGERGGGGAARAGGSGAGRSHRGSSLGRRGPPGRSEVLSRGWRG